MTPFITSIKIWVSQHLYLFKLSAIVAFATSLINCWRSYKKKKKLKSSLKTCLQNIVDGSEQFASVPFSSMGNIFQKIVPRAQCLLIPLKTFLDFFIQNSNETQAQLDSNNHNELQSFCPIIRNFIEDINEYDSTKGNHCGDN